MNIQIIFLDHDCNAFGTWRDIDEAIRELEKLRSTMDIKPIELKDLKKVFKND